MILHRLAAAAVVALFGASFALAAGPTDPQIAHIAYTAGVIDIEAAKLALQKSQNAEVIAFANSMVSDHEAVNEQALALVKKLGVTPEDNDVSRSLKSGAEASAATLNGLTGAAFDKAYIDNEVTYHQAVLDALDKTLVPNAQNADLKGLLEKVRPAIAAHLERAKSIQASLTK